VRLRDTLLSLALAAIVPAVIAAVPIFLKTLPMGLTGVVVLLALFWVYACLVAAVFVLPIFALAPRSRRAPLWIFALWGAAIPWGIVAVFSHPAYGPQPSRFMFTTVGALTGLAYGLIARRVATLHSRSAGRQNLRM